MTFAPLPRPRRPRPPGALLRAFLALLDAGEEDTIGRFLDARGAELVPELLGLVLRETPEDPEGATSRLPALSAFSRAAVPEHPVIAFRSSGAMGGDSGYGGWATLTVSQEGGSFDAAVYDREDRGRDPAVLVRVAGDWEQEGLLLGLLNLGLELLSDPAAFARWRHRFANDPAPVSIAPQATAAEGECVR